MLNFNVKFCYQLTFEEKNSKKDVPEIKTKQNLKKEKKKN